MPIIETEQQTNQNVISGQEYLDAGATKELVGQLRGYAEGYNDGYDAGVAAGGGSGSGGSATAYAWVNNQGPIWLDFSTSPTDKITFGNSKFLNLFRNVDNLITDISIVSCDSVFGESYTFTKVSDTVFTLTIGGQDITFTRDATKDFTLWQATE